MEKKKFLAIVFAGMMAGGAVLQVTVFTSIDSSIGIHIAQIGGLGFAIIIFPIIMRKGFNDFFRH